MILLRQRNYTYYTTNLAWFSKSYNEMKKKANRPPDEAAEAVLKELLAKESKKRKV